MKRARGVLFIILGCAVTALAFRKWKELGFPFEPRFTPGRKDGNISVILMLLGGSAVLYGGWELFLLRGERARTRKQRKEFDEPKTYPSDEPNADTTPRRLS
jgi:hypothetical protein